MRKKGENEDKNSIPLVDMVKNTSGKPTAPMKTTIYENIQTLTANFALKLNKILKNIVDSAAMGNILGTAFIAVCVVALIGAFLGAPLLTIIAGVAALATIGLLEKTGFFKKLQTAGAQEPSEKPSEKSANKPNS